jgi:hypothetical protein
MRCLILMSSVLAVATTASAQKSAPAPDVHPIQDNSFLVEEAYNQEKGVVQHISTFARTAGGATWNYTFTQEWPIAGQRHQLGYTLRIARVEDEAAGGQAGFGDILLNYRYQLIGSGESAVALAPRFSVLAPSGASRRGLGAGGAGLQVNLPLSIAPPGSFVVHSNIGATYTPDAHDAAGNRAATLDYGLAQSVVWLIAPKLNLLLEAAWLSRQVVVGPARTERSAEFLLSPGIRAAVDLRSGLQIVPGLAIPIGLGASRGQRSIFAYLSLEHPFGKRMPALERGISR